MVNTVSATAHFIGCDWGTTSFRLRLIEHGTRRIVAEHAEAAGVKLFSTFAPAERVARMAAHLAAQLAPWRDRADDAPVIVSGMAGSSVGWREVPYASAPFPLDGSAASVASLALPAPGGDAPWRITLVGGVRTADDVMRGEETALIGAAALRPDLLAAGDTLALLAGTHPKHAWLREGRLAEFRTHLTGDLYDALARHSLLAATVRPEAVAADGPVPAAFRAGVAAAKSLGLSAALFQVRARSLLAGADADAGAWFLSGALTGGEIAAVPPGARLLLTGEARRVALYRAALAEYLGDAVAAGAASLDLGAAVIAGQEALLARAAATAPLPTYEESHAQSS